jgi:ADP-heptose:LPS heptosyltransferase
VPGALRGLLEGFQGVKQVITKGQDLPKFDLHCPLMSLPLAFGTTLESIPAEVPYLCAPADKVEEWRQRLGTRTRPRVGIVWSGRLTHKNDQNRSIPLSVLLALAEAGVELVSLQKDVREADREVLTANPQIRDFGSELKNFADTAALVSLLDLVVTVDTAPAHLAGALGKPVWVLLPFWPDWRWLLHREDSPWYPTARLFRQPAFGDWDSVVRRVMEELRERFGLGDTRGKRIAGAEGRL